MPGDETARKEKRSTQHFFFKELHVVSVLPILQYLWLVGQDDDFVSMCGAKLRVKPQPCRCASRGWLGPNLAPFADFRFVASARQDIPDLIAAVTGQR